MQRHVNRNMIAEVTDPVSFDAFPHLVQENKANYMSQGLISFEQLLIDVAYFH